MIKFVQFTVMTLTISALALGLSGCKQEGPAEKAGKEIDKMVDDATQRIEKAGNKTMEDANERINK